MQTHSLIKNTRPLRRTAALLCAALAALGLAGRAGAQTGPLAAPYTSPPQPTPFQWPTYHSGGGPVPAAQYPLDTTPVATANAPYLTPLIDPLQGQLQGTPTELYNGALTQIPSYSIGNYDPTRPPGGIAGGINTFYPNHFADGGNPLPWAAPFNYVAQGVGTVTVDDTNVTAPNAFTSTGGWVSVTDPNGPTPGPVTSPAAGTATNAEYLRLPSGAAGTATWTLSEPVSGNYSLYFHIPNDLPDSSGTAEVRDTQVSYGITVRDASGNVTAATQATTSQTEANDTQFLAGPLQIAAGGTVTVTLSRRGATASVQALNNNADYLVADSMTLQPTIGDVQSAPTAITYDRYPTDFNSPKLQYWGIFVPPGINTVNSAPPSGSSSSAQAILSANPDTSAALNPGTAASFNAGNILLKTGDPARAIDGANTPSPQRRIRQLVYFGRSDPAASVTRSVDDNSGAGFTNGTVTASNVTTPNLSAATASNSEYRSYGAVGGSLAATNLAATWVVPSPAFGTPVFAYAHIPANLTGEKRLTQVYYAVTVNGATQTVVISQAAQGTDSLVLLPTGPLFPAAGSSVTVSLYNSNNSTTAAPAAGSVVVADSITLSTGTGQGAIYCVDGFTGGVVWRYETPGAATGPSAAVFGSPAVVRINVLVTPAVGGTAAVYANKLVVIVGDNNGSVYCLDAIGNGDGTSNVNVLTKDAAGNPIPNQPVTIPQPPYGTVVTPLPPSNTTDAIAYAAVPGNVHVGTTGVYWIYRPDRNRPRYVTGTAVGQIKPVDPTTDLPVPAAFSTASPTVFVDPTVSTTPTAAGLTSNAKVYIGSSNGVLYALDALGNGIDTTTQATLNTSGDPFNFTQDTAVGALNLVPTPKPLWWFSLRGVDPNGSQNTSNADIESAPALSVHQDPTSKQYLPTVYIGSAHEQQVTSNVGRLYALNGRYGPSFNGGRYSPVPTATNYHAPGTFNYNVGQVPQTDASDTADWSFPDANNTVLTTGPLYGFKHQSSTGQPRPALGNITGSPVVFTNIHDATTPTRIYIAANSGQEFPATARPDDTQTGRLWAINLDGSLGTTTGTAVTSAKKWVYPLANDPNDATKDRTNEPYAPIGSFLRATPAIGFVQFPSVITNGDGTAYNPADAFSTTGIDGQSVPMLYVGTRGVNDSALYAVDIDGDMTTATDSRTIYRVTSPNGAIFQSSPALVVNASSTGGNGGSIFAVAGESMYDYGATPITNPFTGLAYPLVRENREFVGVGPVSSPGIAGANTTDLSTAFLGSGVGVAGLTNTSGFTANTTDWVYIGDSGSGLCRGITPKDALYGGIATGLGGIVPYNANPVQTPVLDAIIKAFLVKNQSSTHSLDAQDVGVGASLPVYEWGESAYVRFTNVAPPNPANDPNLYVYDTKLYDKANASPSNTIPFYTSDGTTAQTVTFSLSDADANGGLLDSGSVNPRIITTPPDGFVKDATDPAPTSFPNVTTNLVANNGSRYLGTYTYTISDGSGRNNTPGARRRFQNVKQIVNRYDFDGTNYTLNGTTVISGDATNNNIITNPDGKSFSAVAAVDQPTFGILNPLAVRGGGVPLLNGTGAAVQIGNDLGPYRAVKDPPTLKTIGGTTTTPPGGDRYALQALSNGNDVLRVAPPSSSGVGGNPTVLPNAANGTDPTGITAGTDTAVVVTTTGLISHNTSGDNHDSTSGSAVTGTLKPSDLTDNGLNGAPQFDGFGLNIFDRGALFALGQSLRVKMTVPTGVPFAPPSGRDGLFWNSNFTDAAGLNPDTHGWDSVVNYLPWETPPAPFLVGTPNGSTDYPDIAPGNVTETAFPRGTGSGGDLTSINVTLPQGQKGTIADPIGTRTVIGDPVRVQITVPHYQPANQQLYQEPTTLTTPAQYYPTGQISPVNEAGADNINLNAYAFPMGYVAVKRIYVPNASGFYSQQRPYRDVRIYTGVPVDLRTSIANATTDIGDVAPAFGVQTENDPTYGLFSPYNTPSGTQSPFHDYFKPLEVHNDGNTNLLNVHFDQKVSSNGTLVSLPLYSDSADLLSGILGYDLNPNGSTYGVTGPRTPNTIGGVPEQPYLIRSSLDTDLVRTYARNGNLPSAAYPGATFHKPIPGGDQPATLTVPDVPENGGIFATNVTPTAPMVSLAVPFGTPVGTYTTAPPTDARSLRLFDGIDTAAKNAYIANTTGIRNLYPPKYGGAVGGIGIPTVDKPKGSIPYSPTGEPIDSSGVLEDIYNGFQPISTAGTQLTATVREQRLTDGAPFGVVPLIDAGPAVSSGGATPVFTSSPDFGPAAFRDFGTGNLSLYWTSGRIANSYGLFGANLPFQLDPSTADPKFGHFLPNTPPTGTNPTGAWWTQFTPATAGGTNSGLSIAPGMPGGALYGFDVAVGNSGPYNNTLYSYNVNPKFGTLSGTQAVTPPSASAQVKYGVRGLYTGFPNGNGLYAFWTGSTRGRTALYYNAKDAAANAWPQTTTLLPVPAGLTSVADAAPLLMPAGSNSSNIEVTYSGTAPDGNTDLYVSRYAPDVNTPAKLVLVPFPAVTENLRATGGWYQARDTAWSRTGALNLSVTDRAGVTTPLLYTTPAAPALPAPLFTKAIYDQASGLLVLTGVKVPSGTGTTINTVYVDAATGRVRFSPALLPTQNFARVQATFSPLARRLTVDSRTDTAPVTFLDDKIKPNDDPNLAPVTTDRRWTIWRKAGAVGAANSATLFFKTQRLTAYLPSAISVTSNANGTYTVNLSSVKVNGTTDVTSQVDVDYARGRIYFPIALGAEGLTATVTYAPVGTITTTNLNGTNTTVTTDIVHWQDEQIANDTTAVPTDSAAALDTVLDYPVPLKAAINENNPAAFLDPFASAISPHKVWLFWNSTQNGTADIYSETIDPRFAPATP